MQILMKLLDRIDEIEKQAQRAVEQESRQMNRDSVMLLRGGSSGALTKDGRSYSTSCARKAQARLLGLGTPPSKDDIEAFAAGFGHELRIDKMLTQAGVEFEREPDYQILMANGDEWSGRPDFDSKELGGMEAKSLISPFSVYKAWEGNWPQMKHCVQSASYMTMLNRDTWLICVGNYFHVDLYIGNSKKKYPPQRRWFAVGKDEDNFFIMNSDRDVKLLPFNQQDVLRYYEKLQLDNKSKKLGVRPHEEELKAKTYSRCDARYCLMSGSCDAYDKGELSFDKWMQEYDNKGEK
jgi:hypothetical protein